MFSKQTNQVNTILNSTNADRDFIHKSIVPTDHFQKSLPHLKVPKLDKTCERYLVSQSVLQTDSEHEATKKVVEKFMTGDGKGKASLTLFRSPRAEGSR